MCTHTQHAHPCARTPPPPAPPPRVIPLCLRHRLRKDPLADIDSGDKVREVFKAVFGLE
jgi:magnesium chelatase subunit I